MTSNLSHSKTVMSLFIALNYVLIWDEGIQPIKILKKQAK